jgi:hypothetical protein
MNAQNKSVALLFNPSVYIAGVEALGLGLAAMLLAGLIGSLGNVHFDGVLDTHVGVSAPLWFFLLEGILDWLSLGIVLLVLGKMISQTKFRALDVLGTQALARWPTLVMGSILLPGAFQRITNDLVQQLQAGGFPKISAADGFVFAATAAVLLVLVCWMVVLMYRAFSVSCNVKGGKAIGTFVVGVLIAEIISKICIALVFQHILTSPARASESPAHPAAIAGALPGEPAADLRANAEAFVDLLARKDFAAAETSFDSAMKSALPEATLRAAWEELLGKAGPYQTRLHSRQTKQQGYDVVFVTCQFEKKPMDLKVVYDSEKLVTGFFYVPAAAK